MKTETKYIIAISLIKGIGAAFMKQNIHLIHSYKNNHEMLCGISNKITLDDLEENIIYAEQIIQECTELDITIRTIIDKDYPKQLLEIKDPPPILYLKGNLNLLSKVIAIIGTRKSTDLGNKIAAKLGTYFSDKWSICNGLVDGIDKSAILINNTIAPNVIGVLSGGLNFEKTSSKVTKELASMVLANNGLLISEQEPNKKEDQFSGSKASRIQAGLSNGLILAQSSITGGSKYTLKTFSELKRPIGVIAFEPNSEYQISEEFSANRLLVLDGKKGLLKICDIKKPENLKTSEIIKINNVADYTIFENSIN
ncbi:Predicted Rossmann fold nucleotide-binding protein DprA/Smf involved in DNA uptake [Flavobacterium fryxellicola]|nr:DNA-processing protein DprA [Flavobacterium fryxellicola]SHN77006.1 Predicted Rossmann fold nucleotide-binding protein DprA/Smf involved in DNA uptake [Flavobacterium fryxellicola]